VTSGVTIDAAGPRRLDQLLVAVDRRDRALVIGALGFACAVAWASLALSFRSTSGMDNRMGSMTMMRSWTVSETGVRLLMWAVMMLAMMLPAAVPLALIYVAIGRKASRQGSPVAPASALVSGYVGVWLLFSIAATAAQWELERLSLLSASMAANDARFGGAVVVAAGVYQLTPVKARCLDRCRDPARLIASQWRAGTSGAVRMGVRLGVYCLGCCWVLMALLFVGGVMNLAWVAAIATFILLEKLAPRAPSWGRLVGTAMLLAGTAIALA
jgi:predicted metal-binding membrane protein